MDHGEASGRILAQIDDDRVLRLERDLIRIPSTTFEEGEIADYLAEHMADIGLEGRADERLMASLPAPRSLHSPLDHG